MNILDIFTYVFDADDSGLQESLARSRRELEGLGDTADGAGRAAGRLTTSFGDLVKGAVAAGAAMLSWGAIKAVTVQAAESTVALAAQARALHIGADSLAAWQNANTRAGGSAEAMTATLTALSERTRDPLLALERMADKFRGLNDRKADALGKSLGLDAGTIEMMRKGKDGLRELIEQQFRFSEVTQDQIDAAAAWDVAGKDVNVMLDDMRRRLMVVVIPALTSTLGAAKEFIFWVRDNSRFLGLLAGGALIAGLIVMRGAVVSLAVAFVRLTGAMLTNPMVWLGLAIAAVVAFLALLIDDLIAFNDGANSMIGQFAKKWPIIGEVASFIIGAWKELVAWFGTLPATFGRILDSALVGFTAFGMKIEAIFRKIKAGFDAVKGFASTVLGSIGVGLTVENAQKQVQAASTTPLASISSGAITNSTKSASKTSNITTGPITINTQATDGKGVADALGKGLADQLRQANDEFDNGVAI